MLIRRISISILLFLTLSCFQLSCDTLQEGSVLYNILRKMKFRVTQISTQYPSRLKHYDVLFLQELVKLPTDDEVKNIQDFVREGGILIVSGGNHKTMRGLIEAYGLKLENLQNRLDYAYRYNDEPFFQLNIVEQIRPRTYFTIQADERDMAILYGTENQAVVATLQDGKGRVFFTTSAYLFNENGLKHSGNAALFYNLMSTLPRRARIGLAEGDYYTQEMTRSSPFISFVFKTHWGLAAVYTCLILFVFMTLRGRRFGQPLDVKGNNRRLSTEYVHAMTALYQKGDTRRDILHHIRDRFRSDLANRWRVNPSLDAETFLDELLKRGVVDEDAELSTLVRDLEPKGNISEAQLVDLAKRVETYCTTANLRK